MLTSSGARVENDVVDVITDAEVRVIAAVSNTETLSIGEEKIDY